MKVAAVQLMSGSFELATSTPRHPLTDSISEQIRRALARALHDGVRVLVFPLYEGELPSEAFAPSLSDLQETAKLGRMMICISLASGRSSLIDTDGTVLGEVGNEMESRVFKTTLGKVGLTIARGGKFFKAAEQLVEDSARLIVQPMHALGGMSFEAIDQMRAEHAAHWRYTLVAANFAGERSPDGDRFAGCSLVTLSDGEIPTKATHDAADFVSVELSADAMKDDGLLGDRFRILPKLRKIAEITRFTPPII